MDQSLTAAMSNALFDRVRAFARSQGLAAHFCDFPEDVPALADVVARRVDGTDHVASMRPDLVQLAVRHLDEQRAD